MKANFLVSLFELPTKAGHRDGLRAEVFRCQAAAAV
jgi:hypothetical protein